jgi:hypothetical protein
VKYPIANLIQTGSSSKGKHYTAIYIFKRAMFHFISTTSGAVYICKVAVENYRMQSVGEKF